MHLQHAWCASSVFGFVVQRTLRSGGESTALMLLLGNVNNFPAEWQSLKQTFAKRHTSLLAVALASELGGPVFSGWKNVFTINGNCAKFTIVDPAQSVTGL